MISRLYDIYFREHKARWGAHGWITFAAFAYGTFNNVLLERPERQVTLEVAGLACFSTIIWSAWYALRSPQPVSQPGPSLYGNTLKLFSHPALACVVIISSLVLIRLSRIPLPRIETGKVNAQLSRLAASKVDESNLQQTTKIVASAQKSRLKANPAIVAEAGRRVLQTATENPVLADQAWRAATSLLDYRSFLNSILTNVPSLIPPPGYYEWQYEIVPAENATSDVQISFDTAHLVPANQSAAMEKLWSNLNPNAKLGPHYMMLANAAILIDGMRIKNVVFKNCKIVYNAGAVQMESAYFINCTFSISRNEKGKSFVSNALASLPVDFSPSES